MNRKDKMKPEISSHTANALHKAGAKFNKKFSSNQHKENKNSFMHIYFTT